MAAQVAEFWTKNRGDIRTVVQRADQLAETMRGRAGVLVLYHSDLHAGNVLVGAGDALAVVDWDNPLFAPKERDLMFIGGGIGGAWNDLRENGWFFTGYGSAEIDPFAIAFFRYERIVVDIAEYGAQPSRPPGLGRHSLAISERGIWAPSTAGRSWWDAASDTWLLLCETAVNGPSRAQLKHPSQ